jgi:hypothetical protein
MTAMKSPDIYDENSVFRKLFTEEPKFRKRTQAERMAKIFGDVGPAKAPPALNAPIDDAPIKVSDFLPRF